MSPLSSSNKSKIVSSMDIDCDEIRKEARSRLVNVMHHTSDSYHHANANGAKYFDKMDGMMKLRKLRCHHSMDDSCNYSGCNQYTVTFNFSDLIHQISTEITLYIFIPLGCKPVKRYNFYLDPCILTLR